MFIAESDWFQLENRFAGFLHRLDVLLEPGRGGGRAQLSTAVDPDRNRTANGSAVDTGDIGGRLGSRCANADHARVACYSEVANINVVTLGGEIGSGRGAYPDVMGSCGAIDEGKIAISRVVSPSGVVAQCVATISCVIVAGGIAKERTRSISYAVVAARVAEERTRSISHVPET